MSIIEVDNVVKRYSLGQMQTLRHSLGRLFGSTKAGPASFNALDGINFKVEAGEVLGIIGTNGAGKSTLLKVLSRITTPTTGRMVARGRVAPLIEVGAGLIGDLTGRENIYLNGVILGMSFSEIKRKFDDIVAFAELEQFIETPVKRYSSGMAIRLGFSIATAVQADILIVDEVLAVGDLAFQRKCFDRMEDIIKRQGTTILLVSHNIRQVERLCTRALLLDHGRILMDGKTQEVCREFYERTNSKMRENALAAAGIASVAQASSATGVQTLGVTLLSVELLDAGGELTNAVPFRSNWSVSIRFRTEKRLRQPEFGIGVHTPDMLYLATHHSKHQNTFHHLEPGEYNVRVAFNRPLLTPGVYALRFGIAEGDVEALAFYAENVTHFQVTLAPGSIDVVPPQGEGFFVVDAEWKEPTPATTCELTPA